MRLISPPTETIFTKEPYVPGNKHYISGKEPYISAKEPCISIKEPYTCPQEA